MSARNHLCGAAATGVAPLDTHQASRIVERLAGDAAALIRYDRAIFSARSAACIRSSPPGVLVAGTAFLVAEDDVRTDGTPGAPLEKIAALYRQVGCDVFAHVHGQFCLAIYDEHAERLLVATDRFSTHPLYYAERGSTILFSSRLSALAAECHAPIDPAAMLEYLLHDAIPHPRTPFRDVAKLSPGHVLTVERSGMRIHPYWEVTYPEQRNGVSAGHWAAQLRAAIEHAVSRFVKAEGDHGALGAFLSGGTDSSTVAGMMAKVTGAPTRTFSIGYGEAGYDELAYARTATRWFGFLPHEHVVSPREALDSVSPIVEFYEEPFGNASALPTYACARAARAHGVTVLYAGDGGDELFAGNTRYQTDKILGLYQRLPAAVRRQVIEPLVAAIPDRWPLVGLAPRYVRRSNLPNPHRFLSYHLLLTAPLPSLLAPEFLERVDTTQLLARAEAHYHRAGAVSELNRLMHLDLKLAIADNDVRKVSGMAALAGIEVRYPLLDARLIELAGRIPSHLKLRRFTKRYLFNRALADFLPPEILAKRKHGFGAPIAVWMKTDPGWRELVGDLLHDRRTRERGYLHAAVLDELWRQHQTERSSYYGDMLWPVLMLELWHREHADSAGQRHHAAR
jgi:asparagine synthase (glutamine-hydrolysing)